VLGARRTEDRFLLPLAVLLGPYAAVALDRTRASLSRMPRMRGTIYALAVVAVVPALLQVVSVDATLLVDSRREVERFLAQLPAKSRVEIYGGPIFMPRVPSHIHAVRPGVEPIPDREAIAGVTDLVDPIMDPRPRHPDVIVLATELSSSAMADPSAKNPFGLMSYRDPVSRAFLGRLFNGSFGYVRTLRATCSLPWPLECTSIHNSTAGEAWVFRPHGSQL
jgi:hypothetical protein